MKEQIDFLEEKIRIKAESSRVRLQELFIDYDRLRSGYVTTSQFKRVLDQLLKSVLSSEDIEYVAKRYDTKNNNNVNYRQFCNVINNSFPENNLKQNPDSFVYKNPEYLGTLRSMKRLEPEDEQALNNLLVSLNRYYKKKNIEVLTFFRDFDRNNIGIVTENQFRRSLNEPKLSESEINLIIRKYQHPDVKNTVSYLNFFNDVNTASLEGKSDTEQFTTVSVVPKEEGTLSIQEIIDRISISCHKEGIRIVDFFKDFDKLRSGIITDRQFASGLTYGVQKAAFLSPDEINQLVEYFRKKDGRCDYKSFVETVENVFNVPDMEKKPLSKVVRPPRGLLSKPLNGNLSPQQEDTVMDTLEEIGEKVRKYKLNIFPYFKDFDRSTAYTRNVTKIQFGRVLSTLNLMPSNAQFELLCKKFEDPVTGDVNYPMFCQCVEEDFLASKIEDVKFEDENKAKLNEIDKNLNELIEPDTTNVDFNDLMARIRAHALANRIRIKEFFQDMDPLNSGNLTKSQFVRCISSFGISSIGTLHLSKAETKVLLEKYKYDNEKVSWKRFEEDVESVFTLRELEKNPNMLVPNSNKFLLPPPGTIKWDDETLNSSENYKDVIENLKKVVSQKRVDCWPPFQDYDKLNHGHVTRKQFYQCLSKLGLQVSERDVAVLEAKFLDNLGVNYLSLLNIIQPQNIEPAKYYTLKKELEKINSQKEFYEYSPSTDMQTILAKVKDQVFKKRVSIYEWLKDHDKLNCGRIARETFKRAFNLCNIDIEKSELELIIDYYCSPKDDKLVEYRAFCREIENAFGSDQYEKNPLLDPQQHKAITQVETSNTLRPDEEDILRNSIGRIAERVRAQRINLFPLFEDFDRVKNGYVTQSQFRRVLNDLKLVSMLNDVELMCIIKKYSNKIGTRDDVNYNEFSDRVYQIGSFEYRRP